MTLAIDSRGRLCPLPVIDLAKTIREVEVGQTVTVLADDPAAATDIPAWCRMRGHDYLGATPRDGGVEYLVRRVGAQSSIRPAAGARPPRRRHRRRRTR